MIERSNRAAIATLALCSLSRIDTLQLTLLLSPYHLFSFLFRIERLIGCFE